mmetsp:Transcript_107785/g.300449  ORF Transcript_107785/g.300449 Transcript_107785/m.300449 type:complete len:274 (+) Transcript_107785:1297-2118(+)
MYGHVRGGDVGTHSPPQEGGLCRGALRARLRPPWLRLGRGNPSRHGAGAAGRRRGPVRQGVGARAGVAGRALREGPELLQALVAMEALDLGRVPRRGGDSRGRVPAPGPGGQWLGGHLRLQRAAVEHRGSGGDGRGGQVLRHLPHGHRGAGRIQGAAQRCQHCRGPGCQEAAALCQAHRMDAPPPSGRRLRHHARGAVHREAGRGGTHAPAFLGGHAAARRGLSARAAGRWPYAGNALLPRVHIRHHGHAEGRDALPRQPLLRVPRDAPRQPS